MRRCLLSFSTRRNSRYIAQLLGAGAAAIGGLAGRARINVSIVCDRTPQVCEEIERQVGKDYAEITGEDLSGIILMSLSSANITLLNEGDFSGLSSLEDLYLFNNPGTNLCDAYSGGGTCWDEFYNSVLSDLHAKFSDI